MPGLDPGIHPSSQEEHEGFPKGMDCRVKPGNDGLMEFARSSLARREVIGCFENNGLFRRLHLANDDALFLVLGALDARLDQTAQHLNHDAALFLDGRRDPAATGRRRDLLKREGRHCVSPRD